MKELRFIGVDNWNRPVYRDTLNKIWKDVNCGQGIPHLHSSVNNHFYGEPDMPMMGAYEIISKAPDPKKSITNQMKEGAEQAARNNAALPAPTKDGKKDRG